MKHLRPILLMGLLAGPALALSACGSDEVETETVAQARVISVFPAAVQEENVIDPITATGEVTADKRTDIKPRVDGIIDEIYVDVGDHVSAGDKLFRTRQSDYANRARELEHALQLAQAQLEQADREYERALPLREKGVVSQGKMDLVLTAKQVAASRLGMAETGLAQARQDLKDTIVRAPYEGMITARLMDKGTMVNVMSSSIPVVELVKLDKVEIVAQLPATHLSKIAEGSRATVELDGFDAPIESTLSVINDRVDARTRSVEVRVEVANDNLLIKPGLFAKVRLYPAARPAMTLDRTAVQGLTGDNYVYVDQGGTARRRSVRVRDLDAKRVEVLYGLMAGETVLVGPNVPDLADGAPIDLKLQEFVRDAR